MRMGRPIAGLGHSMPPAEVWDQAQQVLILGLGFLPAPRRIQRSKLTAHPCRCCWASSELEEAGYTHWHPEATHHAEPEEALGPMDQGKRTAHLGSCRGGSCTRCCRPFMVSTSPWWNSCMTSSSRPASFLQPPPEGERII